METLKVGDIVTISGELEREIHPKVGDVVMVDFDTGEELNYAYICESTEGDTVRSFKLRPMTADEIKARNLSAQPGTSNK